MGEVAGSSEPPQHQQLPRRIGRHAVLGYLATGGMSEIFLGREPSGRLVCIKRILPHLARQGTFVSMFIDEARISSLIHHPNVVEVFELGQVGLDLFMVMEYLEGENASGLLRRLVGRGDRLGYGLAAYIVAEACRGLHAAHELCDENGKELHLVHRDVSPQNVFVTYDGQVKLLDFGIATAAHRLARTATGELKGKFSYMSPEQCKGEGLDARSDVFSLGIVLYELSVQRRLFSRSNELMVLKAVCDDPIPRPSRDVADYPPFLEDICTRALTRDKEARYQNAAEMLADLEAAIELLLGSNVDPRELLAKEMNRLFDDRVAEKQKVLSWARAGTELDMPLPSTEVDESVVVPQASMVTQTPGPTRIGVPRKQKRTGHGVMAAIAVAVLAAGAAVAIPILRQGGSAVEAAPRTSTPIAVHVAAPPEGPDLAGPAAPAKPDKVVVRIDTRPAGAHVIVGGKEKGKTPFDLELPAGDGTVSIELRKTGYEKLVQPVATDRDQGLLFSLVPKSSGKHSRDRDKVRDKDRDKDKDAKDRDAKDKDTKDTKDKDRGFRRFD